MFGQNKRDANKDLERLNGPDLGSHGASECVCVCGGGSKYNLPQSEGVQLGPKMSSLN